MAKLCKNQTDDFVHYQFRLAYSRFSQNHFLLLNADVIRVDIGVGNVHVECVRENLHWSRVPWGPSVSDLTDKSRIFVQQKTRLSGAVLGKKNE